MNPTEPALPRLLRLAAACALVFVIWGLYCRFLFVGYESDAVAYLEPARNFARGWGLVTRFFEPAQVAAYPIGFKLPALYLHHGPLAPLILGGAWRIFGMADWVPLGVGFFLTFLTGLLVYRLADELGGERAALTAAVFFWTSPLVMEGNYGALTDPPFILWIAAAGVCLWEAVRPRGSAAWAAGSGLCLGLASCTRLAGQSYWPGFILALVWLLRKRKPAGLFLAALAAAMAALALYNHAAAGIFFYSPGYYTLNWSPSFSGFRASTSYLNITSLQAVLLYPKDFLQKMVTGPAYAANRFLENSFDPYLMACVFFGMLTDFGPGKPAERFKRLALVLALPVIAFNSVISYGAVHYLNPLLPFLSIVAALFLWKFIDENLPISGAWRWLGAPAFCLLFLSPAALQIKQFWKTRPARIEGYAERARLGAFVKERTRPDEVIYTDSHRLVVWQADRPAIRLPATLEDAKKTFDHLPPDALLITSLRSQSEDYDPAWRKALESLSPVMGFVPCEKFSTGYVLGVLFRRPSGCPKPLKSAKPVVPPPQYD